MRAVMAKSLWKDIEARLAWRANPMRAFDDDTPEGRGTYPMSRIIKYAADGYTPF